MMEIRILMLPKLFIFKKVKTQLNDNNYIIC